MQHITPIKWIIRILIIFTLLLVITLYSLADIENFSYNVTNNQEIIIPIQPRVHTFVDHESVISNSFDVTAHPVSISAYVTYQNANTEGPLYPGQVLGSGNVAFADVDVDGMLDLVSNNTIQLGNGDGTFQPPQPVARIVLPSANRVRVEDLNGDNLPDIVMARLGPDAGISILLGNGDGTFLHPRDFAIGEFPFSMEVADVNADARPDLVIGTTSFNVTILLGNGDGTFQTPQAFPVPSKSSRVAVADLNTDGRPDLITGAGGISVLLGNGDGTFQPTQNFTTGFNSSNVAVGDLDDDRIPDVVTANGYPGNGITILMGNGDGTFQLQETFSVSSSPQDVSLGDFNADGALDIVTLNRYSDNAVSVVLGNGDGTFQGIQMFTMPTGILRHMSVADFNMDGKLDLYIGTMVLLGYGDGTFESSQTFSLNDVYLGPNAIASGDLNKDGAPDIITTNNDSNDVSVLLGNGDGTFQIVRLFAVGAVPRSLAIKDLNADDAPDIVITNRNSNDISALLGKGDGTFQGIQTLGVTEGINSPSHRSVAIADLNADRRPDLAVVNSSDAGISVLLGNGDGTFQVAQTVSKEKFYYPISVADLNNDGAFDLVSARGVILGNGDGTFRPVERLSEFGPTAVADLNADGFIDLVIGHNEGPRVLLGNGDGTFQPRQTYGVRFFRAVAIADFNGDDIPDLVAPGSSNPIVMQVLLGHGDGTFAFPQAYAAGFNFGPFTIADFNTDGTPDFAMANYFYSVNSRADNGVLNILLHR